MREMKDSGVEWIGEIPENWCLNRLKFASTYNDESLKESCDSEMEIEYVEIGSVTLEKGVERTEIMRFKDAPSRARRIARKNDIIISTVRTYLRAIALIEKENYIVSTGFCVIRPKKCVDSRFLKYFCSSELFTDQVSACSVGISYPAINASTLMDFHIICPSLYDQGRIADFLDKKCFQVDTLIANVQAQIEKLKAYKQSLITEVVTKGLDPTVPMKDSGVEWIGDAPSHWPVIPSKFLFANCDERRRENDVQLTASQKYGMISQEEYMQRENARIVLADKGLENWKHVEPYDFVISLRSFQGGLEMSEVTGCATWHYIVLRARQIIHPYYYKWLFKSSMYITALQRTCNYIRDGQDLRYSNFVKVPLCIPPISEQRQIADFLDEKCAQIEKLIAIKQAKIEKLEQYKKSLIYEYVTGKREVN